MASVSGVSLPIGESLEDQLENWGLSIPRRIDKKGAVSFACLPDLYKSLFKSPIVIESRESRLKPQRISEFPRRSTISSKREIEEISKLVLKPNDGSRSPLFRVEKSGKKNEVVEITFKGAHDVYECMRYWDIPFITCNELFGAMLGHNRGALSLRFLPGERVKKNTKTEKMDEDLGGRVVNNSLRESYSCPSKLDIAEEPEEKFPKTATEEMILEKKVVATHKIDDDVSGGKKYTLELNGKTNFNQNFELHASLLPGKNQYSISLNDFDTIYKCMLACIKKSCVFLCEKESVLDSNVLLFEYFPNTEFGIKAKIIDLTARYSITAVNKDNYVTYRLYVDGNSLDGKHFSFKTSIGSDLETNERKYTIFKIGLDTEEELSKKEDEKELKKRRRIAQERRGVIAK